MQFSAVQEQTYGNQDNIYNFQINDFQCYLNSFYGNESPQTQFTDVASNIMQIMASQPTFEQKLESAIVSIFKQNPDTAIREHGQLVRFLKEELGKLGITDLEDIDLLKHATLVRDPITFEVNVPFETRPSKTGDMKDLAWHTDAIEQLDDDYLKENV